jgi:hypothetical protein
MESKLYFTDRAGQIYKRLELKCADDHEAAKAASKFIDRLDLELWTGARQVHRFIGRTIDG